MAFTYYRTITIDHTKVPNTDQSNFPVLVSGTYSYLATVANGGLVTNSNGYDIGFYSDSALTTKLKWETEIYTATTGLVVYWVKVPTVSHTSDTVIYMAYGDSGITTDQSDKNNVWDSNYKGVFHLSDGTTLSAADSTSTGNSGTITSTSATTGQIDGGASFNGSSSHINIGSTSIPLQTEAMTIEMWAKTSTSGGKTLSRWDDSGSSYDWLLAVGPTDVNWYASQIFREIFQATVSSLSSGTWYHIFATTDGNRGTTLSVNGGSAATGALLFVGGGSTFTVSLGAGSNGGTATDFWNGQEDEVRISNVVRSADWGKTSYNNQSSPSTFYAVGSQVGGATFIAKKPYEKLQAVNRASTY